MSPSLSYFILKIGFVIVSISCNKKKRCNNTLLVYSECKINELFCYFYYSVESIISSGSIPSQEKMERMIYTDSGSCTGMTSVKLDVGLPGRDLRFYFLQLAYPEND